MLSKKKNTKLIRIGTRSSALALWQAQVVEEQLQAEGYDTKLVPVKSTGDLVLDKPLYELGITGVFTRTLDIAMLNEEIDIAVHSLKDVPTILPKGICQAAVLERGSYKDIIVKKDNLPGFSNLKNATIATGSLRRQAQWLNKYPNHNVTGLRGNVNSRLKKLEESNWHGAIFAEAGLKRLNILPENRETLDWMIPAPAQGAIMITALEADNYFLEACAKLNHRTTEICTSIERSFLNKLEGGCTAPIGAFAQIKDQTIFFKGVLLSEDGNTKLEVEKSALIDDYDTLVQDSVDVILAKGGTELMATFKTDKKTVKVYSTKEITKDQQNLFHRNIDLESANFIKTSISPFNNKIINDKVIITSKNAVKSIIENGDLYLRNFEQIFCVGVRTKRLLESHEGNVVHCAKNSEALANYLISTIEPTNVTYFCGDFRLDYLPNILRNKNFVLEEVITYKTELTPKDVSDEIKGILFYSPSTVKSYLSKNQALDKIAFCIGPTTAEEASKHFENVKTSRVPTIESVIELVNQYYV